MSGFFTASFGIAINGQRYTKYKSYEHFLEVLNSPTTTSVALQLPHEKPNPELLQDLRELIKIIANAPHSKTFSTHFVMYDWNALRELDPIFESKYTHTLDLRGDTSMPNAVDVKDYLVGQFHAGNVPKHLNLRNCAFLYGHVDEVVRSLTRFAPVVESFVLPEGGPVTLESGLHLLCRALYNKLERLELHNNTITSHALKALVDDAIQQKTLKHLTLTGRVNTTKNLLILMPLFSQLHTLTLDGCYDFITADVHTGLSRLIAGAQNLTKLSITNFSFSFGLSADLLSNLAVNHSVLECDFSGSMCFDSTITPTFFHLLDKNTTLQRLNVVSPFATISAKDSILIANMILDHPSSISIEYNTEPEVSQNHPAPTIASSDLSSPKRLRSQ